MTAPAFSTGDRVRRYHAESSGWGDEVGEVVSVGERITREEGLDMHAYAVRWSDEHVSEEAEFLLAREDLVEPGAHAFPGQAPTDD